jgi:predicted RNA-binding protein YlqC (UPF0109 family)
VAERDDDNVFVESEDSAENDDVDQPEADASGSDGEEMSAIDSMREMIEYIARALASNPDAVSVSEEEDGDRIFLHLSVDDQDKGKVIGRDGRVAQSMRSLLRVAAVKAGTRVSLEID